MQTLPFWNSIKECGLPALVHKIPSMAGTDIFYSMHVLLVDEGEYCFTGRLKQSGEADDPKLRWQVDYNGDVSTQTFTHWAYIPAVPKKEGK